MKKTSSIILILAMLLTSFMSLFAVGVNAADPGVVAYQHQTYSWVVSYLYDDDATAVANGAIAKFTNINDGKTNYLKEWRAIGAFGATAGYGCGNKITLISDASKEISVTSSITADVGGRIFTIDGNGITFRGAGRVNINGSDTGCVTIENLTVINTSANSGAVQFGSGDKTVGPKVVLKNSKFVANSPTYATIISASSDIVVEAGTEITNNGTVTSDTRCYGIYLYKATPSVEVKGGTIAASGIGIYVDSASNGITVSGGTITSKTGAALYSAAGGAAVNITGGTLSSENTNNEPLVYLSGSGVTKNIKNVTITAPGGNKALTTMNGSTTIENCTINGGIYTFGGTTIKNTTVTAKGNTPALTVGAGGPEIFNSTFTAENASAIYLKKDHATVLSSAKIKSDSTFVSTGAEVFTVDAGVDPLSIVSGTFMSKGDVSATYVTANADIPSNEYAFDFSGKTISETLTVAKLIDGASVRTVKDSSGIRFQSEISKADYEALIATYGEANVQFGTIIAPKDKITGVFTKEALGEGNYIDIPAVNGVNALEDKYVINAAMVDVKPGNYTRDFAAVPYVTITTANGSVTAYGTWNEEDNVRNIREVAYEALEDVLYVGKVVDEVTVDAQYIENAGYKNKVTSWYENGVLVTAESKGVEFGYTCYSTAQRDVIDDYIA